MNKQQALQTIQNIFGQHMDTDVLTGLQYIENNEDFIVGGETPIIIEATMQLYSDLNESYPEVFSLVDITTSYDKDEEITYLVITLS